MTVFQVLAEVIRTKELFRLIALSKFMYTVEMRTTCFPVRSWLVGELQATVAASIECCERGGWWWGLRLGSTVVRGWYITGGVEGAIETAIEGGARPGVFAEVQ